MKIQNTSVIRRTAKDYIFKSRGKSLVIILSVALCTFLFTTLFTVGGSILTMFKESTQRQVGTSAAGAYKYLIQEEYDRLAADKKIKEISHWICVGEATNKELLKVRTEVHWTDEVSAKKGFCYPEAGNLPQAENEAVFSSLVLSALKINVDPNNYEALLGKKVPLQITINDQTIEKEFTVCGVFTGDRVSMAQFVLVSKVFQEKYAPVPTVSYYDRSTDYNSQICGLINADVDFYIPFRTEHQLIAAAFRNGLPEMVELGVSNASMAGTMDITALLLVVFLLITIFLSGYLIINNIYRINVYSDIRSYGLLKTIGMSGRQLTLLVRYQAIFLSLPGIALGILAGSLVGILLVPVVVSMFNISSAVKVVVRINGWILLLSTLFSFVTVIVSCRKPARLASKVSPIEAVRYTESVKSPKCGRSSSRFSNLSFAARNLSRDKKKVFWVVLSLSLSLVILNSVYTMIHSFSEDKFVENRIATDFSISDATLDNAGVRYSAKNLEGVSAEFLEELSKQDGITELGNIYFENTYQRFTTEDLNKLEENLFSKPRMQSIYTFGNTDLVVDVYREYRAAEVFCYGIDEFVLNNMQIINGQIDMQKFLSGNYILVSEYHMRLSDEEAPIPFFVPGEKITVGANNGKVKEYEVMATIAMPYAFRFQQFTDLDLCYYLPTKEFFEFFGERNPMRTLFNTDDEHEEAIEAWMANYTNEVEPMLQYTSRKVFKQEFKSFTSMIVIVGGLLTAILALIGLLNLTNTMITSILSRKLELAMLEAVGMTKKNQIQGMCVEGLLYTAFTLIAGLILCTLFSVFLVRPMGAEISYYAWKFTLLPVSIVFPIMILITLILPVIIYKCSMKTSVVERLRMSEV